ncbi:protein kinase [Singulisphaera sp. Ch08]|uniref:Protein kinase n=1 Tax=Singulisphaera sp. Ch08 TaxID=3120278 RepID=A0AAU7CSP4_9BACT
MNEPRGEHIPPDMMGADETLAHWVAELAERLEKGEPVDLNELAEAYPEQAEELNRILPTIQRMASFGKAVAFTPDPIRTTNRSAPEDGLGKLGDFRLLREVGRGGMGIVYAAEQISLQRRVALKILPLAAALDPRRHQRFLLEARAAACLHHTHIAPVHAVGSERGVPYYAMQFIDGCTLTQVLQELRGRASGADHGTSPASSARLRELASAFVRSPDGASPAGSGTEPSTSLGTSNRDRAYIRSVAERGRQAAEALDHAHSRGILHRDIKPANLMIDVEGHLWITDFGLAQIQGDSRLTLTGDILGTLRYMSPEQALAKRAVIDGRTDLYSLGATLYELLALQPVFDGGDRTEILRKIAQEEPTPLHKLNPAVPPDLETIILKTLAKDPSGRYATAKDLTDDLDRFLASRSIAARPPGRWERLEKWARRNCAVVIPATLFAAFALLSLAGGLIWSNHWLRRHNEQLRTEQGRVEETSRELKAQRDLAEQRRHIADHHLYAFRLRQAGEAFRGRQFEQTQQILRDSRPGPGEDDLREFAWHHLWRESRAEVALLSERTEQVWSLALSADGRTVATGDRDGTIRLRDAATGELRVGFSGHNHAIGALTFSADGRRLASGSQFDEVDVVRSQGGLVLWETVTGKSLARFDGFDQRSVANLRFDPSGQFLWERSGISGSQYEAGLWRLDGDTDALRPRLIRRWGAGYSFPVSADGRRVAGLEDENRVVVIMEAHSGRVLRRLPRAAHGYRGVGLSEDGRLVATAMVETPGGPLKLAAWEVETGRLLIDRRDGPSGRIVSPLEFGPDGRTLVAQGLEGTMRNMQLDTGETWVNEADPGDEGHSGGEFTLLPGGRLLAWSYRGDHTGPRPLRIYGRVTGAVRATFPGHPDSSNNVIGFPDGRSLVFCSGTQAVVWRFEPSSVPQPAGHSDEAWAVGFASDGLLLATGSDDTDDPQTLKLWDVATGRLLRGWKAHEATTTSIAFQPGHRIIASAGLLPRENLRLWDATDGNLLATLAGHSDRVRTIAFSPDGQRLASAGSDRNIRLWDVATRRCIRTLSGHLDTIRQVAFSPDGYSLASAGNDMTVRLWDIDRAESVWTWKGGVKIAAVAFSPDGRTLAWVHEDGVVQRWDPTREQLLSPLHTGYEELRCLAFSPDGRTLAAAGKSGTIHLWDPVSGQELLTQEGRPCQVNALSFSPDGQSLAACWHDGTVRILRSR